MSHEIWDNRFVERKNRRPAWHGLGTMFDEDAITTPSQALSIIKGDYEVVKEPHFAQYKGQQIETDRFDLIRVGGDAPLAVFGECSEDYHPLSNVQIARAFDAVIGEFPLETMGLLFEGRRFFMTFRAPRTSIRVNGQDDPIEEYVFIQDYKLPGEAFIFGAGATRIVCWNTLQIALNNASMKIPVQHDSDAADLVDHLGNVLVKAIEARHQHHDTLQRMADRMLTLDQAVRAFEIAFPMPAKARWVEGVRGLNGGSIGQQLVNASEQIQARIKTADMNHDYGVKRASEMQDMCISSLNNMVKAQDLGINGWTVYNAAVEVAQYNVNRRGDYEYDLLFGGRANNLDRVARHIVGLVNMPSDN